MLDNEFLKKVTEKVPDSSSLFFDKESGTQDNEKLYTLLKVIESTKETTLQEMVLV